MQAVEMHQLRQRLAAVDVGRAPEESPSVFQLWRDGKLAPTCVARAINLTPGGAASMASILGRSDRVVLEWASGERYPGWDAVCAVAAAAAITVDELESLGHDAMLHGAPARSGDAVTWALAFEYHEAVFEASKALRGRPLGLPGTPREARDVAEAMSTARRELAAVLHAHPDHAGTDIGTDTGAGSGV